MRVAWLGASVLCLGCTFGSTGGSASAGVDDTDGTTSSADGATQPDPTTATMTTVGSMSGGTGTTGTTDVTGSTADPTTMGVVDSSTGTTGDPSLDDGSSGSTGGQGATWCPDMDGDGAGDPSGCVPADPGGFVDNADDCDDGDPYVALCPDNCGALGPNLSCSGDFESFTDEELEPSCPTSDLTYDIPAGPGEWAIRTSDAITSQWYGHGIVDHTLGTGDGRVMYSDLQAPVSGTVYWSETLTVTPNTDYVFEVWLKDTATNEPTAASPRVYVRVDGVDVTPPLTLPNLSGDPATYERVAFGWTTDGDDQLTIELVNDIDAAASAGYDVAIDDVVFATCD